MSRAPGLLPGACISGGVTPAPPWSDKSDMSDPSDLPYLAVIMPGGAACAPRHARIAGLARRTADARPFAP